jgi:TonB family protein
MTARIPNRDRSQRRHEPAGRSRLAGLSSVALICLLLLSTHTHPAAAQGTPAGSPPGAGSAATSTVLPDNALPARFALRFDPESRCPDLRTAGLEDAAVAVVVFLVGPTGVPSRPAIRSSSGSPPLDTAAVSCVLKLRFRPATSLGEGAPVSSWQQAAWRWARVPSQRTADATTASAAPPTPPTPPAPPVANTVPASAVAAASHEPPASPSGVGTVEVRVCVDAKGRLAQNPAVIQSSGDAKFDDAALRVARSGSGHYRPATGSDGKPTSGCEQLAIRPE